MSVKGDRGLPPKRWTIVMVDILLLEGGGKFSMDKINKQICSVANVMDGRFCLNVLARFVT